MVLEAIPYPAIPEACATVGWVRMCLPPWLSRKPPTMCMSAVRAQDTLEATMEVETVIRALTRAVVAPQTSAPVPMAFPLASLWRVVEEAAMVGVVRWMGVMLD